MKKETLTLAPGEILFNEGDSSDGLYLIQEGNVEVFRLRENSELILCILNAGDVIGTMTMVSKSPRTASVRAKKKCILTYFPNEKLKENFKEIPLWAQAVIRDMIFRIKDIDDKLMEATLREKTLQRNVGTIYHHSSQLSYLLASFLRKATLMDDTQTLIYPVKDFLIQAEFILLKKFAYLEKIFNLLQSYNLFKIVPNQKYGPVIPKPNPQILEDYANFAMSVVKKGTNYFVPIRFHNWMSALVRISKKFNNLEQFGKEQLIELLKADLVKENVDSILEQLAQNNLLSDSGTLIQFSPSKLQKTIIFESIARALKDIT